MVLAPAFVKLNPEPLTIPLNVPEPAPPIVLALIMVMALLKVSLVPVKVNAPLPPTPVPFIVMVLVLPKVPLLNPISNVAPDVTLVLVVLPNAVVAPALNVPAETNVLPP